jgi:hypothetical protein
MVGINTSLLGYAMATTKATLPTTVLPNATDTQAVAYADTAAAAPPGKQKIPPGLAKKSATDLPAGNPWKAVLQQAEQQQQLQQLQQLLMLQKLQQQQQQQAKPQQQLVPLQAQPQIVPLQPQSPLQSQQKLEQLLQQQLQKQLQQQLQQQLLL